jgi:hypothetical protein
VYMYVQIHRGRKSSSSQTSGLETLSSNTLPRLTPWQRTSSLVSAFFAGKAHSAYDSVVEGKQIRYGVCRQEASALGVLMMRTVLVLTHERVCFRKTTSRKVPLDYEVDYIPTHEITVLHPLESKDFKPNGPCLLQKTGSHNSMASTASQGSMVHEQTPSAKLTTFAHNSSSKSVGMAEKDPFKIDDEDPNCVVVIETKEDGYNHGRRTILQFDSQELRDSFVHECRANIKHQTEHLAAKRNPGFFRMLQVMWAQIESWCPAKELLTHTM